MESMVQIVHEAGDEWKTLDVGIDFACGIQLYTDVLYCWGIGNQGQLGNGLTQNSAFPVCTLPDVASVSVGKHHACAIKLDGSGYCWGNGRDYQLGNGVGAVSTTPVLVQSQEAWLQLVAGDKVTCGVTVNGNLYCWGTDSTSSENGLLGLGGEPVAQTPTQLEGDEAETLLPCVSILFMAVSKLGAPSDYLDPTSDSYDTADEWAGVYTGFRSVCAYTNFGDCFCWGMVVQSYLTASKPTRHSSFVAWGERCQVACVICTTVGYKLLLAGGNVMQRAMIL
eukprot:scaffold1572_cov21-Tisochrysis_lutea.AAC.2